MILSIIVPGRMLRFIFEGIERPGRAVVVTGRRILEATF
jgi:hypothetical protein